jgi:two-component system sensor histidine kinase YesM
VIEVFDNGGGIPEEELELIRQKMHEPIDYADHLGLANVQERLQLHYGDEYGITVDSLYGRATNVVYRLPPFVKIINNPNRS